METTVKMTENRHFKGVGEIEMTISPLLYMLCGYFKYQNKAGTLAFNNIKELEPFTKIYGGQASKIQ